MSTLLQSKSEIRKRVLEKRDSLSEKERLKNSLVINSSIYKFFLKEFRASATNEKVSGPLMRSDTEPQKKVEFCDLTIALYDPINSEVNLTALAGKLQKQGVTVLKPAMVDDQGHMEFVPWDEVFDPSGIVPHPSRTVPPNNIDVIVCPVVAFDAKKNRLGYGGGYYDRYLSRLRSDTLKVGVAFSCQEVEELPINKFDVPLDLIVTENS